MKSVVEKYYANVQCTVEEYPLSTTRTYLSYLVVIIQAFLFCCLFLGDKLKLVLPKMPKEFYEVFEENKIAIGIFIFFGGNMAQGMITNTGALEIFLDGELIWSKLQTGEACSMKFLLNALKPKN